MSRCSKYVHVPFDRPGFQQNDLYLSLFAHNFAAYRVALGAVKGEMIALVVVGPAALNVAEVAMSLSRRSWSAARRAIFRPALVETVLVPIATLDLNLVL